ncbi:hypothetical protein ACWFQ8_18575 [Streptomyces sp. NPDC055254]
MNITRTLTRAAIAAALATALGSGFTATAGAAHPPTSPSSREYLF